MWNVLLNNWLQSAGFRYLLGCMVKAHHSGKQYPDRLLVINISECVSAAEKNESKKILVAWIYDMMLWGDAYITHSISFESIKNSTSYKISMELWIIYHAYVVTICGNTTKITLGRIIVRTQCDAAVYTHVHHNEERCAITITMTS